MKKTNVSKKRKKKEFVDSVVRSTVHCDVHRHPCWCVVVQ